MNNLTTVTTPVRTVALRAKDQPPFQLCIHGQDAGTTFLRRAIEYRRKSPPPSTK